MQPVPVQRSRIRRRRPGGVLGVGCKREARWMAHSSVSGRGIKIGGRTARRRGPNGWVPGREENSRAG